jgi:hypothetical protein
MSECPSGLKVDHRFVLCRPLQLCAPNNTGFHLQSCLSACGTFVHPRREDAPCETLNVLCGQLSSLQSRFLSLEQRRHRPGVGMATEDAATTTMRPAFMATHSIDHSIVRIIGEVSRMAASTGHEYGVGTAGKDGAGVGGGGSPDGGACCRSSAVRHLSRRTSGARPRLPRSSANYGNCTWPLLTSRTYQV